MTATDELCHMLAKAGVEYVLDEEYGKKYPPEQRVTWSCDIAGEDMTITARDYCIGRDESGEWEYCLDLEFHEVFTPAQAIAATLGRGECYIETTDNWLPAMCYHRCTTCGAFFAVIDASGDIAPNCCPNCGRKVAGE